MMEPNGEWNDEPSEPEISVAALGGGLSEPAAPQDGTAAGEEDQHLTGERFGKFVIVGEVALGGMAEVFLGVQHGLEGFTKVVVIKRVMAQFSSNPDFVRMFVDEARLAARLEHPNIVRTHEFGEVAGQYYTAMEYLPGEDLTKVLNKLAISRQAMPLSVAASIIAQVCAGLQFAHDLTDTSGRPLDLVHRDVNPANILLTYGGEVKVIDFGVAKTSANAQTISGTIKGKIAYMSPEQLLGRGVDRRSDVFSVGVVLMELLTGRPLFMRDSEASTIYAIMNDPIRPPSRTRPEIPAALDEIVMRALARTPADRYDSAEELGSALEGFLADQPKCDHRVLGRMLEDLFGTTRAQAKRSIAQTRSLGRNISLVMKLRTDVRSDLGETIDALAHGSDLGSGPSRAETEASPSRVPMLVLAAIVVLGIVGGGVFAVYGTELFGGSTPPASAEAIAQASVQIESTPPGAAISIGGEPTGLTTPATVTGITAHQIIVRLELAGHAPLSENLDVPAGRTITKHFTLATEGGGRLVISELPREAVVFVDGEPHDAGLAIDLAPGTHEVRVVVNGRTLVQQQIETTKGFQSWMLSGDKLVRK